MEKIEIGAGLMLTALSFWGIVQNVYIAIILFIIGISLILHGCFELYFKPQVFLKCLVKKWLMKRQWTILSGINETEYKKGYHFVIVAENKSGYRVSVTRSKKNSGVLIFHSTISKDTQRDSLLVLLTDQQKNQLLERIRLFLASKDRPFEGITWPLDKVLIEGVLPINSHISEQSVSDKANEVVFAIVGINTLIRESLGSIKCAM